MSMEPHAIPEVSFPSGELRPVDPAIAGRLLLSGLNQMSRWHRPGGKLSAQTMPPIRVTDTPGGEAFNSNAVIDIGALRRAVAHWRPRLETVLRERFGVRLLAVYTYPAQVVFCRDPFRGLSDLVGRRVRTSSVGQSELVETLGGTPVVIPFSEIVPAMRSGVVACAITGAGSGNAIGLHEVSTHISRLGVSWGVSVFAANQAAWDALPEAVRQQLERGLAELQAQVWDGADQETQDGFECNAGRPTCANGRPGRMTIVEERWEDDARRLRLLRDTVVPNWVERCGQGCAEAWNRFMAPAVGVAAKVEP